MQASSSFWKKKRKVPTSKPKAGPSKKKSKATVDEPSFRVESPSVDASMDVIFDFLNCFVIEFSNTFAIRVMLPQAGLTMLR